MTRNLRPLLWIIFIKFLFLIFFQLSVFNPFTSIINFKKYNCELYKSFLFNEQSLKNERSPYF